MEKINKKYCKQDEKFKEIIHQLPSSNEFINYRHKVMKAIEEYEKLPCVQKGTEGFLRTIKRKASPFIKGHFTLAIVGKMSAGKSTFINALLGCQNLLPTGHFQTTCVLTKIEHSSEKSIEILFGDGSKQILKEEDFGKLQMLVAIEPEYSSLPVNIINKLIVKGWNMEEICTPDIILGLEETSRCSIDKSKLKAYINSHPKCKIATEVTIKYPLPEDCQGWRIVDTPGVEAVGGIDVETMEFLTAKNEFGGNNVDAIIILHKGSDNIEDKSINDFVKEIYAQLSDEVKKRLFFVVTNAAQRAFQDNEEEYMKKAKALFIDKFKIKSDHLIAVDSLMEIVYRYVRSNKKDIISMTASKEIPDNSWCESTWKSCRHLLKDIKDTLEDDNKNVNNETMLAMVQGWSNFISLRGIINSFVRLEKTNAFNELIHTIRESVNQNINYRKNDEALLQKGINEIQGQSNILKNTEYEKNNTLEEIKKNFDQGSLNQRFDFIEKIIKEKIESEDASYKDIRREAANLYDLADKTKTNLFLEMKLELGKYIQVSQSKVFFNKPDFDDLEQQAEEIATREKLVNKSRKVPGVCCSKYQSYTENVRVVDHKKKLDEFKTTSCRHIRSKAGEFKSKIKNEVEIYVDLVDGTLKKNIEEQRAHLDALMSMYNTSSEQDLIKHKDMIQCEISNLNNYLLSLSKY